MFEVSFVKLLVVFVVGLIVIGPERLPKVARTIGRIVGRLKNYMAQVRSEIDHEFDMEQLRKLQGDTESQMRTIQDDYQSEMNELETKFRTITQDPDKTPADKPAVKTD